MFFDVILTPGSGSTTQTEILHAKDATLATVPSLAKGLKKGTV